MGFRVVEKWICDVCEQEYERDVTGGNMPPDGWKRLVLPSQIIGVQSVNIVCSRTCEIMFENGVISDYRVFVKPNSDYVAFRASGQDEKRNAIAMLEHTTYEAVERTIEMILKDARITYEKNRWAPNGTPRHTIFGFIDEPIIRASKYTSYFPSIFFERAIIDRDEELNSVYAKDTFIVWISFFLKKKELTKWRQQLIPLLIP